MGLSFKGRTAGFYPADRISRFRGPTQQTLSMQYLGMSKIWDVVAGDHGIGKTLATALFWKRFNLFLTFFWIVLVPVAIFTGWIHSTSFVSVLSLVALILASQSSWQASRVEHKADVRDPDTDVEDPKLKK